MKDCYCMLCCSNDCKFEQPDDGSYTYWQCGKKQILTPYGEELAKRVEERLRDMDERYKNDRIQAVSQT